MPLSAIWLVLVFPPPASHYPLDDGEAEAGATNFLNKRLLDKMGVGDHIKIARNGIEAMEYLVSAYEGERDCHVPDLILLDINMPLVNGWELLERYDLMSDEFKRRIIVLMLTTSLRQNDMDRAEKVPSVRGFIHKPLTEQEFWRVLNDNFDAI